MRCDLCTCVTWLTYRCAITYMNKVAHVCHNKLTLVTCCNCSMTCPIHMCHMTDPYVRHVFTRATCCNCFRNCCNCSQTPFICMSNMKESFLTYECGTHMNVSCHILRHAHEWTKSRLCMSYVTHMNESCRTCEWVMSLTSKWHLGDMKSHSHERVMSHIWLIHTCDKTHSCVCRKVCHDTFICVPHSYKWCEGVIHASFLGMYPGTHMISNHVTIWMHHVTHERVISHMWIGFVWTVCK